MTPQEFYANVGDRFGVIGGDRVNPHRGVDFPWGQGTPIPSWCAGTVVRNEYNSVIGWIIAIETSGGWAGFCHMASQSPLPVGSSVSFGQTVGLVGNTGSASRGAHLHATFSTVGNHPGTSPVVDPLPWILANLSSTAGGGTTPFPTSKGSNDMPELYSAPMPATVPTDLKTRYPYLTGGKPTYFLLGGSAGTAFNAKVTQDQTLASQWAKLLAPTLSNPSDVIIPLSWGYALELHGQAVAPLNVNADFGDITIPPITVPPADNTELVAALNAVVAAVAALPAEIDRYADGKKQS